MRKSNFVKISMITIMTFGLLSGCANKSNVPVTGQENIGATSDGSTNRLEAVATGTAVGAGLGAVIGKKLGDTKFGALIGGMVGAVTGDIVHKTSQAAATNEQAYEEAAKANNQKSDEFNKASNEMENTMSSSNK